MSFFGPEVHLAQDLGTAAKRFQTLYIDDVNVNGAVLPAVSGRNLGSASKLWDLFGNVVSAGSLTSISLGVNQGSPGTTIVFANLLEDVGGDSLQITVAGIISRITSTRRHKSLEQDWSSGNWFDKLQPKLFVYKTRPHDQQVGFIAEDLHEVFPICVNYDAEGLPSGYQDRPLTAALVSEVQSLKTEVKQLKEKVSSLQALEERIKALEAKL